MSPASPGLNPQSPALVSLQPPSPLARDHREEAPGHQVAVKNPPAKTILSPPCMPTLSTTPVSCEDTIEDDDDSLNQRLTDLENNSQHLSRAEVFKRMNEAVNESIVDCPSDPSFHPDSSDQSVDSAVSDQSSSVSSSSPRKKIRIFLRKPVTKQSPDPENIASGSWRLSSAPSFPSSLGPIKVTNTSSTRRMVYGEVQDKVKIHIKPLIKTKKKVKVDPKTENTVDGREVVEKKLKYICDECGRRCSSVSEVKNHPCDTSVQCEDCLPGVVTVFKNMNVLRQHLKQIHPVQERARCGVLECRKTFPNKTLLKLHQKRFHLQTDAVNNDSGDLSGFYVESTPESESNFNQTIGETEEFYFGDKGGEQSHVDATCMTGVEIQNSVCTLNGTSDVIETECHGELVNNQDDDDELLALEKLAGDLSNDEEDHDEEESYINTDQEVPDNDDAMEDNSSSNINITDNNDAMEGITSSTINDTVTSEAVAKTSSSSFVSLAADESLNDDTADVDAPDSVQSDWSHYPEVMTPRSQYKPTHQYQCLKCGKMFNTSVRFTNHKKNCRGEGGLVKPIMTKIKRKPNPRFQELKTNWSEALVGKARCRMCGRNNYKEEDLSKHQLKCRGTLHRYEARFECPYCENPKKIFNNEHSMRRHVGVAHAKEAVEDGWDYEAKKSKTKGLAENHLFR